MSLYKSEYFNFADYQEEDKTTLTHPDGLHYFCFEHVGPASKLVHMNSTDALAQLKLVYNHIPPNPFSLKVNLGGKGFFLVKYDKPANYFCLKFWWVSQATSSNIPLKLNQAPQWNEYDINRSNLEVLF